jgi:DNA-binding CsgD family transcriptional regulator
MSRQSRSTLEFPPEIGATLPAKQLMMYALGGWPGGDTSVPYRTGESDSHGQRLQTVSAVQGMLQQLSRREAQIVRLRYGIGTRAHAAHEISERLGLMPHQVERLERRAFRKLRDATVTEDIIEGPATRRDPSPSDDCNPPIPPTPYPLPVDSDPVKNPWDEV